MKPYPYNTNLAAEYYVLSMLYRKGLDAYLTLGNKKAVDIIVSKNDGAILTIDVKGLAGSTCWPMDNFNKSNENHFIVLVAFVNKISEDQSIPECWIVPSKKVKEILYKNPKGNRQVIDRSTIKRERPGYLNDWESIVELCKKKSKRTK